MKDPLYPLWLSINTEDTKEIGISETCWQAYNLNRILMLCSLRTECLGRLQANGNIICPQNMDAQWCRIQTIARKLFSRFRIAPE